MSETSPTGEQAARRTQGSLTTSLLADRRDTGRDGSQARAGQAPRFLPREEAAAPGWDLRVSPARGAGSPRTSWDAGPTSAGQSASPHHEVSSTADVGPWEEPASGDATHPSTHRALPLQGRHPLLSKRVLQLLKVVQVAGSCGPPRGYRGGRFSHSKAGWGPRTTRLREEGPAFPSQRPPPAVAPL